jgi:dephospho-CoA kinase
VFSDSGALARLTSISHPLINEELLEELRALPPSAGVVMLDMAILTEGDLGQIEAPYRYRVVITVEAEPAQREERAVARGSDRDDVRRRMSLQSDELTRRAVADFVITNNGTMADLIQQVDEIWERLSTLI